MRKAWNFEDLTNKKFGRLTVIERAISKKGTTYWTCKCTCGAVKRVISSKLKNGNTKSCGCLRRELSKQKMTTHGMSKSNIYSIWFDMKCRCTNPTDPAFNNYGGRGITICNEWFSFETFYKDMGDRPKNLTLERIDNNKGYSPDNCRWATRKEQNNNRRNTQFITLVYKGVEKTMSLKSWSEVVGISNATIHARLNKLGWNEHDAVLKPLRGRY